VGVVTVAERAFAQAVPVGGVSPSERLRGLLEGGVLPSGPAEGTDLAAGVRLGVALVGEGSAGRVVLVSDGNETAGSLLDAALAADAAGVPIDVVPLDVSRGPDVVFESLVAPRTGRSGQRVRVTAVLRSAERVGGRLDVLAAGRSVDISPEDASMDGVRLELEPGANRVSFVALLPESGPVTFEGVFTPDGGDAADAVSRNNRQRATTFVRGEGRVLVYGMDPIGPRPMVEALRGRGLGVEVLLPGEGPDSLTALQAYDAVVLFDVPQSAVSLREQRDLASYVHDTGGGFMMVGGPNSFGAGGWIDTAIADILPVRLDPPAKRELPRGALGLVLDNSGSMGAVVGGTGLSQLEVAIEGAVAALRALSSRDLVMVTRFDSGFEVVVRPVPAGGKGEVERAMRRITSGGGTNMLPALAETVERLSGESAAVKHVVVLSDGQTTGSGSMMERVIGAARAAEITVSAITIGDMPNDALMQRLASATGGSYYKVSTSRGLAELPEIFIKEAQLVRRSLIWEGVGVLPELTAGGAVAGTVLSGLPEVSGYVVTADRGGASLVTSRVRTDPDVADPLTAQWQHGLGRVAAVTTDAGARWAVGWPGWSGYGDFWEGHLRWVMRPAGSAEVRVATRSEGDETFVTVTALDDAGEPVNFDVMRGTVAHDDGGRIESSPVRLRQTGPGRYEGSFASDRTGTYLLALRYDSGGVGGERGTVTASVERPFADEYRAQASNRALLERVAGVTGGRVLDVGAVGSGGAVDLFSREGLEKPVALTPIWHWLALGFVGLFLGDVAIRRVRLSPSKALVWVVGAGRRVEGVGAGGLGSLRTARERTRVRLGGVAGAGGGVSGDGSSSGDAAGAGGGGRESGAGSVRAGVGLGAGDGVAGGGGDVGRVSSAGRRERGAGAVGEEADGGGGEAGAVGADEAGGLSRLMAAKRRAREAQMSDDDVGGGSRG